MIHIIICSGSENTQKQLLSSFMALEQDLRISLSIRSMYSGRKLCQSLMRQQIQRGVLNLGQPSNVSNGYGQEFNKQSELDRVDLLFLDIELPDTNGIAVADFIRNSLELMTLPIVFMADCENFAMKLFAFQPLDFRIKPITLQVLEEIMINYLKSSVAKQVSFMYKKEKCYNQIPYCDVIFFNSDSRKIRVVCQGYEDTFYGKLSDFKDNLPSEFVQIHKSYIINLRFVKSYKNRTVTLTNGIVLSITRPYHELVGIRLRSLPI